MTERELSKTNRLYVMMPFGVKSDPAEPRGEIIDFDRVYADLIRPAAVAAGWEVVRVDEIVRPGPISDDYLREIYFADLVVADVSMPNANVFYELGIRHAVATGGTLLVAQSGTQLPFDIAHLRVIFYELASPAFERARTTLEKALREYRPTDDTSANPVRRFLEKLGATSDPQTRGAEFEQELHGRVARARNAEQLIAVWGWLQHLPALPALALLSLADRLADYEAWHTSVDVLRAALAARPTDFEIHRQLGWHLRHLGPEAEEEAVAELRRALDLNPGDPESLGMLAGILKRRGDYEGAAALYDQGVKLSPDSLYMKVNEAATTIMVTPSDDRGVDLYRQLYEQISSNPQLQSDMWAELVLGEAAFAVGNISLAQQHFQRAASLTHSPKDLRSAADQLEILAAVGFRTDDANRLAALVRGLSIKGHTEAPVVVASPSATSPNTPVIIHLSDVHFGTRTVDGAQVGMHRFFEGEYEKTLAAHLATEFRSRRAHFAHESDRLYLVISGDLTYTAEVSEFDQARSFLEETCSALGIPRERVVLVPGNHDIHWPSTTVDLSHRFDNYLGFLVRFYGESLFRETYPRVLWDFHVNSSRPIPSDLFSVHHRDGISIVGLNSCVYETNQDHYGFIGGRQLDGLAEEVEDRGGTTSDLRIAVVHHHLHPFPEPVTAKEGDQVWMDISTIRDAGLVERRLEKLGFDIVLHGHKHKPQLRETLVRDREDTRRGAARLLVCGAGSVGVNAKELEHNYSNHYEVIEVLRCPRRAGTDFLRIEWRELSLRPDSDWVTNEQWIVLG